MTAGESPDGKNESDRSSNITVLRIETLSSMPIIEVEYNEEGLCEEADPIAIELIGYWEIFCHIAYVYFRKFLIHLCDGVLNFLLKAKMSE